MNQRRTWHHTLQSPARDDAPGIFVRSSDLPEAAIGDHVLVEATEGDASPARRGTIAAVDDRDGVAFFRVDFDPSNPGR